MKVSFEKWKGWDAVKCVAGKNILTAGISAGPRILSFTHNGGENILYEDQTDFRVGEWLMYGGHRFTIAPENDDSYFPDNEPCEVSIADSAVHISAKQQPNGLRLSLVISASPYGDFCIDHLLLNEGRADWQGALWAITCIPRSHIVSGLCQTANIHFWPGTDRLKWKQAKGRITVDDGDFRGKAGWYSASPELEATSPEGRFIIKSQAASDPAVYVDNGSNVEIFVCQHHAELETLSEEHLVTHGSSVVHRQYWQYTAV